MPLPPEPDDAQVRTTSRTKARMLPCDPVYHETMFFGALVCLAKSQWEDGNNILGRHGLENLKDAKHLIGRTKLGGRVPPQISQNLDKLYGLIAEESAERHYGECQDFCERFACELAVVYEKPVEVGFDYVGSRNGASSEYTTLLSGPGKVSDRRSLRQPMHDFAHALGPIRLMRCGPEYYRIE